MRFSTGRSIAPSIWITVSALPSGSGPDRPGPRWVTLTLVAVTLILNHSRADLRAFALRAKVVRMDPAGSG
jgi:hypothetical protein